LFDGKINLVVAMGKLKMKTHSSFQKHRENKKNLQHRLSKSINVYNFDTPSYGPLSLAAMVEQYIFMNIFLVENIEQYFYEYGFGNYFFF